MHTQKYSHLLVLIPIFLLMIACGQSVTSTPGAASPRPQTSFTDHYPNNPMVHQSGQTIVDPSGKPLRFQGVNLGAWLLWEGWEYGKGLNVSETTILENMSQLVGTQAAADFQQQIFSNYITETDIKAIAQLGFNSVRLPINAKILEDDNHPYIYKDSGWAIIDQTINWCEKYHIYVILDLHSVPGGQSRLSPSDPNPAGQLIWSSAEDQKRTVAIWQAMAARYKDRAIVAGYDLINEPLPPNGSQLLDLETRLVAAIRQVDPYHMVIVEGGKFSSDFSMFSQPLSGNQAYGFHMYTWFGDNRAKSLASLKELSQTQNVPLWAGEFGENNYNMISTTVTMYNDPNNDINGGWCFWTWKKVPGSHPALVAISAPASWVPVMNWIGAPDKKNTPSPSQALAGMADFIKAVRYENDRIDPQMLAALTQK